MVILNWATAIGCRRTCESRTNLMWALVVCGRMQPRAKMGTHMPSPALCVAGGASRPTMCPEAPVRRVSREHDAGAGAV